MFKDLLIIAAVMVLVGFLLYWIVERVEHDSVAKLGYEIGLEKADVILTYEEMSKLLKEHFNDFALVNNFVRGYEVVYFKNNKTSQYISLVSKDDFEKIMPEYEELQEKQKKDMQDAEKEKLFENYFQ